MKKKENKNPPKKKLSERDSQLLWGLSGGFCAYCQEPLIDMETLKHTAHQAHVIARNDENLPSFRDIPVDEKDRYENLFLLHPTCHEKTKFFPLEELQAIKINHEKHIRDTLNGIYNPYPVGNGKFVKYPHVIYNPIEKKYNPISSYMIIFFMCSLVIFLLILYFNFLKAEKIKSIFLFGVLIVISILYIVKAIKDLKDKPVRIVHEAECIFAGCNGKVSIVRPAPLYDSFTKRYIPEPGMGICSFDPTHTFTVPINLSLSNRGDYHSFK